MGLQRSILASAFAAALLLAALGSAAAQQPGDCGYYVNRSGETVPRPCGNVREERPPPGASAICRDGVYSFSRHHSGTCSGHGGVRNWLR
jgi:hypothetical protein